MNRQIFDPIHLPCPDMAGCVNPDPTLTQKSLEMVATLRAKFAAQFTKKPSKNIPAQYRQHCTVDGAKALGHEVEL